MRAHFYHLIYQLYVVCAGYFVQDIYCYCDLWLYYRLLSKSKILKKILWWVFLVPTILKIIMVKTSPCSNVSATPIGQTGLEMGWFPLGNGVCLIMKKAPSESPIWQLKKRELLLPLSFLITKPIKLDLSNLHYGSEHKVAWLEKITLQHHYKPH